MDSDAQRFIEKMGLFFEADGASRTAGRLLGVLMLSEAPLSLDELADRLQVSKASVSTNARGLERSGVIERVTTPGDRRDYYQLAEGMPDQLMARRIAHLDSLRRLVACVRRDGDVCAPVDARLQSYETFFAQMVMAMSDVRARWSAGSEPGGTLRAIL